MSKTEEQDDSVVVQTMSMGQLSTKATVDDDVRSLPISPVADISIRAGENGVSSGGSKFKTNDMKKVCSNYIIPFCIYVAIPGYIAGMTIGAYVVQNNFEPVFVLGENETIPDGACPNIEIFPTLSDGYKIALSLIPMVMVFWLILGFNLNSHIAAPATLFTTCFLAMMFFQSDPNGIGKGGQNGALISAGFILLTIFDRMVWTVFDYAANVFAAFSFLRVIQLWGMIDPMREHFESLANTPSRKILLVAFCFAIMIALVAPGGSNFLIAGAILIDMNIMKLPPGPEKDRFDKGIGAICLFGNGLTSAFNLVGVCIIAITEDIVELVVAANASRPCADFDLRCGEREVGYHFSLQFWFLTMFSGYYMCYLFLGTVRDASFQRDFFLIFLCVLAYAFAQFITATFIGPELPCLTSAGAATITYVVYIIMEKKLGYTLQTSSSPERNNEVYGFMEKKGYLIPFCLLGGLLLAIDVIPNFEEFLTAQGTQYEFIFNPVILDIATSCVSFKRRFPLFAHPAITVSFVAMITPMLVPYRKNKDNSAIDEEIENHRAHPHDNSSNLISLDVKAFASMLKTRRDEEEYYQSIQKPSPNDNQDVSQAEVAVQSRPRLPRMHQDRIMLHTIKVMDNKANFWYRYRICMRRAFSSAYHESIGVMISITSYASIARVMTGFQMTQALSRGLVSIFKDNLGGFPFFVPVLGMIGAALTGSTTTSNFMFGQLQIETAIQLGLVTGGPNGRGSAWSYAGAQILGATAGEAISPMNAVFSTILLGGRFPDSDLIKLVLPVFLPWLLVCCITSYIALFVLQPEPTPVL